MAALVFCFIPRAVFSESLSQTGVLQTIITLLNQQDRTKISPDDYDSTSIKDIVQFMTPAGYRIKIRYLNFGIALAESLKIARDPDLRARLIEMVQWSRKTEVRAEALMNLASFYDPAHKKYFKEALLDNKMDVRLAAVEAIQTWNQPDALKLLKMSVARDWSPFMQVFAAQALLAMGDETSLPVLWQGLSNDSWVIRALSARFLGDYASPNDYEKLVQVMDNETTNDFVVAECAIAALKLISKRSDPVSYSSAQKGWRDNSEVSYTMGKDHVIDIEPLVIVPPQLRIPKSLQISARINARLMTLLKDRMDVPLGPIQAADPVLQDLYSLKTPTGYALKARYDKLSYLLVEGLAGSSDPNIRFELQQVAGRSTYASVRATALVALSYSREKEDIILIQEALRDSRPFVRLAALESVENGRFSEMLPTVAAVANTDRCPALQAYATQVLSKFGDEGARFMLATNINSLDWPARAMNYWYLGRYGSTDDYQLVLSRLPMEENPFVQAEMCLTLLRLAPVEE